MRCVTLSEAAVTLDDLCETAVCDREEVLLTHKSGNVLLVSQHDWEATQETLRLILDKKSLRSLLEGHRVRDEDGVPLGKSPEEVFSDLDDSHSAPS